MNQPKNLKVLLFDIETAPNLGYIWAKWEQDVIEFERGWYVLSFAYKWLGEKEIKTVALPDFAAYKKDKEDDYELMQALWKLFDEAHIIVGHNSDAFDIKRANSRFIHHRLGPPSPYQTYDTLKAARRITSNNSNKLDDLGANWHLGRKLAHTGKHLWLGCMKGDKKAWKMMRQYNAQDVALLEKLYLLIRPWDKAHPNITLYTGELTSCPKCGSKRLQKRGEQVNRAGVYQSYWCVSCDSYPRGERIKEIKVKLR